MLEAAVESGLRSLFVGFETTSTANLIAHDKRQNVDRDYAAAIRRLHDLGVMVNASFVFGMDDDDPSVFERTVAWAVEHGVETATFHILTPYPATPLFRQMEGEGRLLHRNWDVYDTAHVVFRPKHLTVEQLSEGYAWCYRRLCSHRSIWRRRPRDWRAVPAYLAMAYLYKRSNLMWHLLIKYGLTSRVWHPLVECTRRRHLRFRRRLEAEDASQPVRCSAVVSPGV